MVGTETRSAGSTAFPHSYAFRTRIIASDDVQAVLFASRTLGAVGPGLLDCCTDGNTRCGLILRPSALRRLENGFSWPWRPLQMIDSEISAP